ncbi:putative protein-like, partial [Thraustotheca clavata]
MTFLDLFGPTLLKNGPPRTDIVIDQEAHKASYDWNTVTCDRCDQHIVGPRYCCDDNSNFDLCGACYPHAEDLKPGCTFTEVPIPEKHVPLRKDEVSTTDTLTGKSVFVYFSAHWCPPCRGFTPMLAEYYNHHHESKNFEVVFVSSDQDDDAFDEYFGEMPWLALPYIDRECKEALSKKYNVSGIPSLVLLDDKGEVINANARSKIAQDPEAANFPYVPKTFRQILGNHFINNTGDTIGSTELKGKVLMLYFSASWCGPCHSFTPLLIEAYNAAKAKGHEFELIFITGDRSKEDFDTYFAKMPWYAVPFEASKSVYDDLGEMYDVNGIPHLVILGPNQGPIRPIINKDAVSTVSGDVSAENFPWPPASVICLMVFLRVDFFCHGLDADALTAHVNELKQLSTEFQAGTVCKGD